MKQYKIARLIGSAKPDFSNPDAANHKCPVGGGVPGRAVGASESESRASCFGTNEYMRVLVLWAG